LGKQACCLAFGVAILIYFSEGVVIFHASVANWYIYFFIKVLKLRKGSL
jgi:hypothetical protein